MQRNKELRLASRENFRQNFPGETNHCFKEVTRLDTPLTDIQLAGIHSQFLRYLIHELQILPDRLQAGDYVIKIRQGDGVRIFRQLLGDDLAACLEDIVERDLQLFAIDLQQILDLLFRGAQVQLHVLQAGLRVVRKLLGALLHVLVGDEGAHHAETTIIN